jgi:hypothetical protein
VHTETLLGEQSAKVSLGVVVLWEEGVVEQLLSLSLFFGLNCVRSPLAALFYC